MSNDREERPSQRPTVVPPERGAAAEGSGDAGGLPAEVASIGGHRIVRVRGAGGQGIVYEALDRGTGRPVALKTLLPDASADDLRRFEREIEVLANLDHPNIPPLFEPGVHAGRPWFTMRLVDGPTLAEHAEALGLDAKGCVRLILGACDAVAHAHGRGIIHRDLKSDNIRVDPAGQPQVLDFGLARSVADPTLTRASGPMGTVSHAPPELIAGDVRHVDVRADVYALGVVLYRLLAGRLPIEMPDSVPAALDRILHADPAPPSSHERAFTAGVDSDLDAICLKCLAKSPGDRYATVLDLERDLRRWLDGEPVEARGRARGYRLRKFVWRHRWPVAGAVVAAGAVAAFVVTLLLQASELREEERKSRAMADAFTSMVEDVDPDRAVEEGLSAAPDQPGTAAELVDRVGRRASDALDTGLRERAAILTAVGHAYMAIGIPSRAESTYDSARELLVGSGDATDDEIAAADIELSVARAAAEPLASSSEESLRAVVGRLLARPDASRALLARAQRELAEHLRRCGRHAEALGLVREALAIGSAIADGEREVIKMRILEAALLTDLGEPDDAMAVLANADADADALLERRRQAGHPALARIAHQRARALEALGRVDEAVAQCEQAFARLERSYGVAHPLVVAAARDAAGLLSRVGRHEEAEERFRNLLELQRIMLGEHDPASHRTMLDLASELDALGRGPEAQQLRAEATIVKRRLDLAVP